MQLTRKVILQIAEEVGLPIFCHKTKGDDRYFNVGDPPNRSTATLVSNYALRLSNTFPDVHPDVADLVPNKSRISIALETPHIWGEPTYDMDWYEAAIHEVAHYSFIAGKKIKDIVLRGMETEIQCYLRSLSWTETHAPRFTTSYAQYLYSKLPSAFSADEQEKLRPIFTACAGYATTRANAGFQWWWDRFGG